MVVVVMGDGDGYYRLLIEFLAPTLCSLRRTYGCSESLRRPALHVSFETICYGPSVESVVLNVSTVWSTAGR